MKLKYLIAAIPLMISTRAIAVESYDHGSSIKLIVKAQVPQFREAVSFPPEASMLNIALYRLPTSDESGGVGSGSSSDTSSEQSSLLHKDSLNICPIDLAKGVDFIRTEKSFTLKAAAGVVVALSFDIISDVLPEGLYSSSVKYVQLLNLLDASTLKVVANIANEVSYCVPEVTLKTRREKQRDL